MTVAGPSIWRRLRYTRLRDALRGRFDASLDWRLVIAEADLPAEISGVIEQVVRRTRLWHREKVDVAAELVAHFQDGLEAGCSPDELVKTFGDPRQTAQLIRRAKKRGRSLVWQLWRCGCWALGAMVIAYVAASLWMFMDRPSVTTDYLAIINKRALSVPESEKAWPLYRDALLAMGRQLGQSEWPPGFLAASTAKPGQADWPAADKFLRDHADAIARLREAASRRDLGLVAATSYAALPERDRQALGISATQQEIEAAKNQTLTDRWLISTLLYDVQLLREPPSLLAADARRAAQAGDGETALADVFAMLGVAHHCQEKPFLVSLLVASAVQQQAYEVTRDIIANHRKLWTDEQLRELAHRIAAAKIDWRRGFEAERLSFYDSMQRIYTDDGHGDGRLALQVTKDQNLFELLNSVISGATNTPSATAFSHGGLAVFALPAMNMVVASRKEMTETFDRLTSLAVEEFETPLWEKPNSPTLDEAVRAIENEPLGRQRYLFVHLLLPAYDALREAAAKLEGERDGALIGIALELYHRQHNAWPQTLQELSPRWLPELPVDRITGKPLYYKVVDDRPLIYSAGADGDGGRIPVEANGEPMEHGAWPSNVRSSPPPDGDWVIWSTVP